jgi:hypothetical protein
VIERLNKSNLKLNADKCQFGEEVLNILGYQISSDGIHICPDKLIRMASWNVPKNGKMLEKQLGFINYSRELIPMYSKLMAPLEKLRHAESIEWTPELQSIMDKVRNILASNLVLSYPDFD